MSFQPVRPLVDFVPADELVIEDLETLKVMADPLRLRIRELMTTPCTVKQIAQSLDIPATKLYYHINLLEKHNLIVVVDARVVSGIIEKHYQVAARTIRVAPHLLSGSTENAESLRLSVDTVFDDTKADLLESVVAGTIDDREDAEPHTGASLRSARLRLTEQEARELFSQIHALLERFEEVSDHNRDAQTAHARIYKLFTVVFPTSRPDRPKSE